MQLKQGMKENIRVERKQGGVIEDMNNMNR